MSIELPKVDSCFFCDILASEDSHWSTWAEDKLTLTLLNGRQFEVGQSIVIPKRHAPTILDLEHDELGAVLGAARRASEAMMHTLDPVGILLYQNNGVGSGQEVPHFHLHVVPRQAGSDWGLGPPHLAELDRRANNAKFDHSVETPEKLRTAELLRQGRSGQDEPFAD